MARTAVLLLLGIFCSATADRYHPSLRFNGKGAKLTLERSEQTAAFWQEQAQDAIDRKLQTDQDLRTARGLIMFLGDGMSVPTLAAARTLLGQREGRTGEESQLAFEAFPTVGLSKTYCVDAQIPDSACTATAYLCGVKNNYGAIGVNAEVVRGDCDASLDTATHLESIAAWALQAGRDVGIVTTTRITHASPSGAYAHVANRNWESDTDVLADGHNVTRCPDIARQLINSYPGNQFKVIFGGGRREFLPDTYLDEEGEYGRRTDGRNLINEWLESKAEQGLNHSYIWDRSQLETAGDYVLGLFESSHLQYNLQRNVTTEPSLAELTEAAIKRLQTNPNGYFLFVEGGRIDHAHHDVFVQIALDETIELSKAVETAKETADSDTLIVVTSDHAHVMSINGYTHRGGDILGVSDILDTDGVPYLTLSYTNGPGFRPHTNGIRQDFSAEEGFRSGDLEWRATVEVPREDETHGGDDVAVFASGPRHHVFTGLYEQNHIPHLMAYAGCIGPGRQACSAAAAYTPAAVAMLLAAFVLMY